MACSSVPPEAKVTPALSAAVPTTAAVAPVAPNQAPMAGIAAGKNMLTAGIITGASFLTIGTTVLFQTFFTPFHKSSSQPYSGRPVLGFSVPAPPRDSSSCASSGVMCARIVSPPRPCVCNCCAKAIIDILLSLWLCGHFAAWQCLSHFANGGQHSQHLWIGFFQIFFCVQAAFNHKLHKHWIFAFVH